MVVGRSAARGAGAARGRSSRARMKHRAGSAAALNALQLKPERDPLRLVVPRLRGPGCARLREKRPPEGRVDLVRLQAFQSGGSGSLPHAGPSRSGHVGRGCASEVVKSTRPEGGTTSGRLPAGRACGSASGRACGSASSSMCWFKLGGCAVTPAPLRGSPRGRPGAALPATSVGPFGVGGRRGVAVRPARGARRGTGPSLRGWSAD